MEGLDLLGAVSTALANERVTFRIKSVDSDKLRSKLAGSTGAFAAAGLHFVDAAPKAALDIAVPVIRDKMREYGVEAEATISSAPAGKQRALSEFFPGLVVGAVLGGASLAIWKLVARIIAR